MVFIPPNIILQQPFLLKTSLQISAGLESISILVPHLRHHILMTMVRLSLVPSIICNNELRKSRPLGNTFCSVGSSFADRTLANIAGAASVAEGFNKTRTYTPRPCAGSCANDWIERNVALQHSRWYLTAQSSVDSSVPVVGGADAGVNFFQDVRTPLAPMLLPILNFTVDENLFPRKSYSLHPTRK